MEYRSLRHKIAVEQAERKARYASFSNILKQAREAGHSAAMACIPVPMAVSGYGVYSEGVCGFAWIKVTKGTSSFARWLKKEKIVDHKSYSGGYDIWVSDYNQSMDRKYAYAKAFAKVLQDAGIDCYAMSRMD